MDTHVFYVVLLQKLLHNIFRDTTSLLAGFMFLLIIYEHLLVFAVVFMFISCKAFYSLY